MVFTLISCETNITEIMDENPDINLSYPIENRGIRPVILGEKKKNPYTIENMKAALDSLKAYPENLDGCLKAPSLVNDIEITTTDLYVRFLPQDSAQFKKLMTDTTLTLFDFPLDYEIIQTGEYYQDPTVAGDYTWLYTRVSKDYVFPKDIRYEILEELFNGFYGRSYRF